jgi:hypothetical protein
VQEAPSLLMSSSWQPEVSNLPSSSGGAEPDPTGCGVAPTILKVTVPPGAMVTSAGCHLSWGVPSIVALVAGLAGCAAAGQEGTKSRVPSRATARQRRTGGIGRATRR